MEEGKRCHAVHIVISIKNDTLFVSKRLFDPGDRRGHFGQEIGIAEGLQTRMKKRLHGIKGVEAGEEKTGDKSRNPEVFGCPAHLIGVLFPGQNPTALHRAKIRQSGACWQPGERINRATRASLSRS